MSDDRRTRRKALWPLRLLIVAAIVVPAAAFAVLAVATYRTSESTARSTIETNTTVLREHALKVMETVELVSNALAELIADRSDEEIVGDSSIPFLARSILRQLVQVQSVWVLNAQGAPLLSVGDPVALGVAHADEEYFSALRDSAGLSEYVSRVYPAGRNGEAPYFVLAQRLTINGTFRGVIATAVSSRYFADVYAELSGDSELIAALVRNDGSVLAIHPFPDVDLSTVPPLETFADAIRGGPASGTFTLTPTETSASDWLISFRRIGVHPIYVAAALPLDSVRVDWLRGIGRILALAVPLVAALLLLSVIAFRRTRRESDALERLQAETALREETEEQLRQSSKMEAVGQLSGGIAHDFNNLLTAIGGNVELLGRKLPDGSPLMRNVDGAREGVRRAASLTQRLLAFSRRQALQPTEIDPNRLISGMTDLLRRTLGEHIDVEVVLGAGIWAIYADANQLENAVLNLAINARDAMKSGGRLTIETANTHIDDGYVAREALKDVKAGQYVLVAVSDTGTGMPPSVAARAFDPFFTTKAPGEGTGLGLSMVYGFVKQSGGHAKIYSEEGQGTTIRLYLPRSASGDVQTKAATAIATPAEIAGNGQVIMVVEDDPGVLAFEVETLTSAGYRVRSARNGRDAIASLEADLAVDLLFTDVVLADGPNGRAVADRALGLKPGLPVLFATGYTQNAIVHHGRLDQGVTLLSKPFSADDLLRMVRRMLGEPPGGP